MTDSLVRQQVNMQSEDQKYCVDLVKWYKYIILFLTGMALWGTFNPNLFSVYRITIGHPYPLFALLLLFLCVAKAELEFWYFLVAMSVFSILSMLQTGSKLGSVAIPMVSLVVLYVLSLSHFTENDRKGISFLFAVTIVYLFVNSLGYDFTIRANADDDMQKLLLNPNTWGLYTTSCYVIWNSVTNIDSWKCKLLDVVFIVISLIAVNNYMCRTSAVALLFFLLVRFLFLKWVSYRWLFAGCVLLVIIGVAIPFLYIGLKELVSQMEIGGKPLYSGREVIWMNMFDAFAENPMAWLVGLGTESGVDIENGEAIGVHNSFWTLIVNFGVLYFGLYMYLLLRFIKDACIKNLDYVGKKMVLASVTGAFVIGFAEANLTILNFSYLYILPLAMAIDRGRQHIARDEGLIGV